MFDLLHPLHRIAITTVVIVFGSWCVWSGLSDSSQPSYAVSPSAPDVSGVVVSSSRQLMGTIFGVSVWTADGNQDQASIAIQHALDQVAELELKISSWDSRSETSTLNREAANRAVSVGPELAALIDQSLMWSHRTSGAFDITAGPLFELWTRAREESRVPTKLQIRNCLDQVGYVHVARQHDTVRFTNSGMKIGFGAIGKGYAADQVGRTLRKQGIGDFIVDAGGDVLVHGSQGALPWRVAIRHPRSDGVLATHEASDCAMVTSGDYEQFSMIDGVRYSHIVDPRTGWPTSELASVTVIAPNATDADALATALFVMGPRSGLAFVDTLPDTEAIMMLTSGSIQMSRGLHLQDGLLQVCLEKPHDDTIGENVARELTDEF